MGKSAPKITQQRLDMGELTRLAESQAERNIARSIALEEQYSPETAAFRTQAMQDLLNMPGTSSEVDAIRQQLFQDFGAADTQLDMPELERSQLFDQAAQQVLADLQLGGALDPETRNLVMREAAQRTGGSGFLGGVVGRDIGARDLGLTSMNLRNQRIGQALNVGQMQQAQNVQQQGLKASLNQANAALQQQGLSNRMNIGGFFESLGQQDLGNRMALAQFGQSIQSPIAGLDPGQLASAMVGDMNAANQAGAQQAGLNASQKNANAQTGVAAAGVAVSIAAMI